MKNEREMFEEWAYSKKWNIFRVRDIGGDGYADKYVDDFVNGAWHGWQASANRQGYKLVPIEPTQSMVDNAVDKTPETPSQDYWHCSQPISDDQAVACYKAMIGAIE